MAKLQYVGRAPDGDAVVVPRLYAANAQAAVAATTSSVNAQVAATAALLTSRSYVDAQDLGRAHKAEVDAADLLYIPASTLSQPLGVAGLDSSGNLLSGQVPAGIRTDRIAQCFSVKQGQVLFDAVGSGISSGGNTNFTGSLTHVMGALGNCVVLHVQVLSSTARTIGVTYGGVDMIFVDKQATYTAAPPAVYEVMTFILLNPPGGSQTCTVTVVGGVDYVTANTISYSGVGGWGTSVRGFSTVSGSPASITVASSADQMVTGIFGVANPSDTNAFGTLSPNQRSTYASAKPATWAAVIGDGPGAGSVTLSTNFTPAGNGWGGIVTPLLPISATGATGSVTLTAPYTAVATTLPGQMLATIPIPDLGYAYRPFPFAWVKGDSSGAARPAARNVGTGSWGLVTAQNPVNSRIYGLGLLTDSYYTDIYAMLPHAAALQTPTTVPPVQGAMDLNLYATLWSGTSYTFYPDDIVYFVLCLPAL